MMTFWIVAGLMVSGALLFVLAPLLQHEPPVFRASRRAALVAVYRDQLRELEADVNAGLLSRERHDEVYAEIERRLLDDAQNEKDGAERIVARDRLVAVVTGVMLPMVAVGLYFLVGNPQALAPGVAAVAEREPPHGLDTRQVEAMVGRLAARLEQNPEDIAGWVVLARSYTTLRRHEDAARAYANVISRQPEDAQRLADYADLLAMAQGRRLQGEPETFIMRALAADPNNVKALALAGTVAFEKRDYAGALRHWGRILQLVPQESEFAGSIRANIAQVHALGQDPGGRNASAQRP